MLIGELSRKAQLSRDTIRFYEKKGLINPQPPASEFNTYKNYTEGNLRRLTLIKKAKMFGFTLNEIAELIELIEMNEASCVFLNEKAKEKIDSINKKIQELEEMKALILLRINEAQANCGEMQKDSNCKQLDTRTQELNGLSVIETLNTK